MKVYLDSSVVLRRLLRQPGALADWGTWSEVYASILLYVEVMRVIDRLRLEGVLDDQKRAEIVRQIDKICEAIHLVQLSPLILKRASQAFPVIVGTLDALHLATALLLQESKRLQLIFLTHDTQLGVAAQNMGFLIKGIF